jgi:hypothetical protein
LSQTHRVSWSAVLAGVFVFFALLGLLLAVGSALALSLVALEEGEFPSLAAVVVGGAFGLAGILLAFFLAGYVAGLPAARAARPDAVLNGLVTWAVIAALSGISVGGRVVLVAGGLVAGRSASTLVEEMNPRVVSDLKLADGKVTSRVITNRVPEGILGAITEIGKRREEIAKDPDLQRTARGLRRFGAAASWSTVLVLVTGAGSAAAGASFAGDGRRVSLRRRTALRVREERDPA